MAMDRRDKQMFNTYFDAVEVAGNRLEVLMERVKDRELTRGVMAVVEDLAFGTADMRDTVSRL